MLNLIFIILLLVSIDVIFWRFVKQIFCKGTNRLAFYATSLYWGLVVVGLVLIMFFSSNPLVFANNLYLRLSLAFFFSLYLSKLIALAFTSIVWLFHTLKRNLTSLGSASQTLTSLPTNPMTRQEFLARTTLVAASIPLTTAGVGIISGAHDYQVRKQKLVLANLPPCFEGLKIAQISDIHAGSFYNKTAVKGGVGMLLAQKPDIVFFTGDLVNGQAKEMQDYMNIFDKVKAPLGVYAILGNHDYGNYANWDKWTMQEKNRIIEDIRRVHHNLGWDLLLNESILLKEGAEQIAIIGVENWGDKLRFPKFSQIERAKKGTEKANIKLLLSHDPSHWRAKILPQHQDIDVMFAGHTHGMQFGVEVGNFQWSPVQYVYPEWAGLYQEGKQALYVNRGYGYIGFPGRIGMPPEITIFELTKS